MSFSLIASIGRRTGDILYGFGDFCRFSGRTLSWVPSMLALRANRTSLYRQFYIVGTKSVPVMMVTGVFVGAVLAVQAGPQFKAMGMIDSLGAIINPSVLSELGPILAGIMLVGRVGGMFTAELGTMRVTEQISALKAIGADPIRVLVVPRFLACIILVPILVFYASFMGILGGYYISVELYDANPAAFWDLARTAVATYDIFTGSIKCFFFGAATALICCFMGFRSETGAAGVGRACTKSFVTSCMAILILDFFLAVLISGIIEMIWGVELKLM